MFKWVELSEKNPDPRFEALSKYLNESGLDNEMSYSQLSEEHDLKSRIDELSGAHTQIRVSGGWRDLVKDAIETWPATLLTLRSADALVCENHIWWPRNFLSESVQILIAEQVNGLDLTGAALILGATPEARATVHALVRVGVNKVLISDPDEAKGQAMVKQMTRVYFNIGFEFVGCAKITQLPAAPSVAVNTLDHQQFANELAEMSYINFLMLGGTWLDLSPGAHVSSLDEEAKTVGAQVINGREVWARSDLQWIHYIEAGQFDIRKALSVESLAIAYQRASEQATN